VETSVQRLHAGPRNLGAPDNGYRSFIKNTDSVNSVTVAASSGTIEGAPSVTLSPLESIEICGKGNNWWVLAQVDTAIL
jgi:hypothetical protein